MDGLEARLGTPPPPSPGDGEPVGTAPSVHESKVLVDAGSLQQHPGDKDANSTHDAPAAALSHDDPAREGAEDRDADIAQATLAEPAHTQQPNEGHAQQTAGECQHCLCWPRSKESLGQPQPLEELLSNVWKSIGAATDAMNALIGSLRAYAASDRPKSGKNLPIADVAVTMAFSLNVMARFAEAMVTITVARGYIFPRVACKNTFEQHLAMLDCRDSKLREVEEGLVKTLEDAQPLLEARRTFLEVEASMRRRRLGRIAIRSAAMVLLPFVPTVSAALTAIDTLLIMAWYGIEGVDVSEEDLRSTSATVENLLKEIDEKLTSVRGQRKDLVAIRAKVTAQRDDPATQRLYKLLVKLYEAYELAQSVFAFGSKADGTAGEPAPDQVSVSTATTLEPVSASADPLISASSSSAVIDTTHGIKDKSLQAVYGDLREVLQALGEPPKSAPLLYEVEDSEWAILNETLAATRAVKLDELLSRDRAAAAAAQ